MYAVVKSGGKQYKVQEGETFRVEKLPGDVGAEIAKFRAWMPEYNNAGSRNTRKTYKDRVATWSAGFLVGLETHLSRPRLKAKGNDWFCFGGELALGYIRRGNLAFNPTLDGGNENTIETVSAGAWGDINLSGFVLQLGATLYFL